MRICILALDGVFDTGLTALLDTFATANEIAAMQGSTVTPIEVRLAGLRRHIRTGQGLHAKVESMATMPRPDWVVVPALATKQPQPLLDALARRDVGKAREQLSRWHEQGIGLAAACVGTFLLAEAGVLDHRQATTSWPLAPLFRQRYPDVELDDSRMLVACERIVTAGAMMGHMDLALWLLRQASPDLANDVARFMLIDHRASQAHYIIPDYVAHADPLVARFERWARKRLSRGFSLQDAAGALHVHTRTLQRRMDEVLGKSPMAFFQDLRIERAQQLVVAGLDLEAIASEVGYADSATLRTLLRRKLGRGVRELRAELR